MSLTKLKNCRLIRNNRIETDYLWFRDGKFMDPEKIFFDEKVEADFEIDCKNNIIAPGFIDVQINGAFGVDFSENTKHVKDGIDTVAKGILKHGVTAFCPTLVTSDSKMYKEILPHIKRSEGGIEGATILGTHVEGPFINKTKCGAHAKELICEDLTGGLNTLMETYGNLDNIAIFTIAPELPGALDVIRKLREKNIYVSIGHSMANLTIGIEAVHHGANFITHLFNAMMPFHHRDPYLVGLLATDLPHEIYYGLITDCIHTHPAAIRIAYHTHPKGLVIITDATPATGLSCGKHHIGTQQVEITKDKRAVIAGTNTLAGSIATMDECIREFRKATNCSIVEAIESASLHPAEMLSLSNKGRLDYGCDADFVILDDRLNIISTWIAGKKVYVSL